jgi:hypothetical protein
MKQIKILALLCLTTFVMRSQQTSASILLNYYRAPQQERVKVTRNQTTWDKFERHIVEAQSKSMRAALDNLKLDGLSKEERSAKITAAIAKTRDPAQFNMQKDWHIIAYLLTGDATLKEEHLANEPLHNVIFGGVKTSVRSGYGAVRYFDAKLVAETAAALVAANRKVIAGRYDPVVMKKFRIYAPPGPDEKKAILGVIEELTTFFQKAAATHEEVIVFMS